MFKKLVSVILVLLGVSCATGYGPSGLGGGYSEEKIDDDSYIISFYGNGYASEERVWNFWIYRCAEFTRLQGYDYFAIIPLDKKKSSLDKDDRGGKLYEFTELDLSLLTGGRADRYSLEKVQYYYTTITTYSSRARVDMYKKTSPLEKDKLLLDAQTIMDEIGPYVKTNGKAQLPVRKELIIRATIKAMRQSAPDVSKEKKV